VEITVRGRFFCGCVVDLLSLVNVGSLTDSESDELPKSDVCDCETRRRDAETEEF
jgi:hypothetical protein